MTLAWSVSGANYTGKAWAPTADPLETEIGARHALAKYAVGQSVPCWYGPGHPEEVRLTRAVRRKLAHIPILIGLGMVGTAALGAIAIAKDRGLGPAVAEARGQWRQVDPTLRRFVLLVSTAVLLALSLMISLTLSG